MAGSNASGCKPAKDSMIRAEFVGGEGSRKSSRLHSLDKHAQSPMPETRAKTTYSHVPPRPEELPPGMQVNLKAILPWPKPV